MVVIQENNSLLDYSNPEDVESWSPSSLILGVLNGAATVEMSVKVS